jgi:hypothetical protein
LIRCSGGLFQAISESDTTPQIDQLEALCRSTDMELRALRIETGLVAPDAKREIETKYQKLAEATLQTMKKAWVVLGKGDDRGKLFELIVVSSERKKLIDRGDKHLLVRLALPREDQIHADIWPYIKQGEEKVNLSTDVVAEDNNGNYAGGYQAKAMSPEAYLEREKRRAQKGRAGHYAKNILMRFPDNYNLG